MEMVIESVRIHARANCEQFHLRMQQQQQHQHQQPQTE